MSLLKNIRYKNATKTLFLIDILYMKDLNAIYGFKNGDLIIKQLGLLLKNLLKNEISLLLENKLNRKISYEFKRKHADVFSLIFFEDLDTSILMKIKNLILAKLQTFQFNTKNPIAKINIDVTIGCSKSNNDKIVVYAEKALKNAKLNFESYMYFDSNLYINEALTQNLVEIIKYNIDKKSVEPYFQAIYDNTNDCIYKYEALMRLFDKNGNILLPNAFLEKAKQYRLYTRLMKILINKVFDIIIKHSIHVSINLEYNDIINPLIKNTIIEKLQESDIGKYLTIEILESQKIHNFDTVNDFIQKIKEYHVKIAIDDFGTGFSNYDYILKLNVDYIKIDGSLIEKIDEEIYSNLIKSIVGFCKKQDIKLIAEFVYDIKKFRYVKSLDIEYSQGYYIQKPLPIKTILEK